MKSQGQELESTHELESTQELAVDLRVGILGTILGVLPQCMHCDKNVARHESIPCVVVMWVSLDATHLFVVLIAL
jgi:hypothetical protein